jgi:aspartate-semialdehyde dehydrogenase
MGKELAEELSAASSASWDVLLLDEQVSQGTMTSLGDEAVVIQPVSAEAFAGLDAVFFAGEASTVMQFWKAAYLSGAAVVDLTGALEGQPHVLVRSPLVELSAGSLAEPSTAGSKPDGMTLAEISAHPVSVLLALVEVRLGPLGFSRMVATVLQPASEMGNEGVDEMHQQTVSLLSFKPLRREIYDAQIAFNLVASLGEGARTDLARTTEKVQRHIGLLAGEEAVRSTRLQMLQAPVFHGYTASVWVEMSQRLSTETIRGALVKDGQMVEEDSAGNQMAVGRGEVLFRLGSEQASETDSFWLWIAADNLRLAARNAVACALELIEQKPLRGLR